MKLSLKLVLTVSQMSRLSARYNLFWFPKLLVKSLVDFCTKFEFSESTYTGVPTPSQMFRCPSGTGAARGQHGALSVSKCK